MQKQYLLWPVLTAALAAGLFGLSVMHLLRIGTADLRRSSDEAAVVHSPPIEDVGDFTLQTSNGGVVQASAHAKTAEDPLSRIGRCISKSIKRELISGYELDIENVDGRIAVKGAASSSEMRSKIREIAEDCADGAEISIDIRLY